MDSQKLLITDIASGLKSTDFKVRKNSVLFLSRIDKPEVIDLLSPLLNDPSEEIRLHCKKIIDFLSTKYDNSKELISKQDKLKIKQEIANSSFSPEKLLQLILVNDPKTKIASIMSFYGIKNEQILITFKKFIQLETDETVIATYIKAIGSIGGSDEISFLQKYLSHTDNRVKSNTIEALSELGSYEEIIDDILLMADSNDERLKLTATQYLSRIDVDVLLCEFERVLNIGSAIQKNAAIKISLLHDIEKTLNFYISNFELLSDELKTIVIAHLQQSNTNEAIEFLASKGIILKTQLSTKTTNSNISINDKFIFEIEDELKKADEFYYEFGLKFLELKQYKEAIQEMNSALKINPKHFKAWRECGIAYKELNNFKNAIYCLDKATAICPDDIDSWDYKGRTFKDINDEQNAFECFNTVAVLKNQIAGTTNNDSIDSTDNQPEVINEVINTFNNSDNDDSDISDNNEETQECPRCKIENLVSRKNCRKCGYKFLVSDSNKQSYCPECGCQLNDQANKCHECGYQLKSINKAELNSTKNNINESTLKNLDYNYEHDTSEYSNKVAVLKNQASDMTNITSTQIQQTNDSIDNTANQPEVINEVINTINNSDNNDSDISDNNEETQECPRCKIENLISRKNCRKCGYKFLVSDNNTQSNCPECGCQLKIQDSKCHECGYQLKNINEVELNSPTNNKIISSKICPECGFAVKLNSGMCQECGYSFSSEKSEITPETQSKLKNLKNNKSNYTNTILNVCPECGFSLPELSTNCPECGYSTTSKCPECGEVITNGKNCKNCGYLLIDKTKCPECNTLNSNSNVCKNCGFRLF